METENRVAESVHEERFPYSMLGECCWVKCPIRAFAVFRTFFFPRLKRAKIRDTKMDTNQFDVACHNKSSAAHMYEL